MSGYTALILTCQRARLPRKATSATAVQWTFWPAKVQPHQDAAGDLNTHLHDRCGLLGVYALASMLVVSHSPAACS